MSDHITEVQFRELMELYDDSGIHSRALRAVTEAAMAMERESCAKTLEALNSHDKHDWFAPDDEHAECAYCFVIETGADAIRKRGDVLYDSTH